MQDSTDTHVYRWWVPLSYVTKADPATKKSQWLSEEEATKTITVDGAESNGWVLFNYDQQSIYIQ